MCLLNWHRPNPLLYAVLLIKHDSSFYKLVCAKKKSSFLRRSSVRLEAEITDTVFHIISNVINFFLRRWIFCVISGRIWARAGAKTQEISLKLKPRPNDRNISTQHHDRNIVGRNICCTRLATMLRCVATYWVMLAQIWKWSKFSRNICGWCLMLWSFGQVLRVRSFGINPE